jgi:hypothetical protein
MAVIPPINLFTDIAKLEPWALNLVGNISDE